MKKTEVIYSSGESRTGTGRGVDFMLAEVDGVELYAERLADDYDSETGSYEDLKADSLHLAEEQGIDPDTLKFWYD